MAKTVHADVKKAAVRKASVANLQKGAITPRRIMNGPLEWYEITEQTRFVLNNRLASSLKLRLAEQRSEQPNLPKIEVLTADINEIMRVKTSAKSFSSLRTMKNILQKYA